MNVNPKFEIVHTGPYKFHARFVARNGETVWVTESYRRRQSALDAVWILTSALDRTRDIRILPVDERTK